MALNGTIQGNFSGTSASNVKPVLEWSATQNISNNTSTVTAHLVFIKSNSYWYPYNLNGHQVSMSFDGNNAKANRTFDLRNRSREVVWSRTVTVNHNSDGTKRLNISVSGDTGNMGGYNFGANIDLNTIPRSSSMSVSPTSLNFGETVKFNISRASGSFTHLINYNINGIGGSAVAKTSSTTPTWTIPLDLMKHCTTATYINITLWLDTYNGNSKIGVKQYSVRVNVPASVVPSISLFSTVEKNTKISAIGLAANNFLQGNSQIECTSNATSQYGASIVKYTIDITGLPSVNSGNTIINLSGATSHVGAKTAKLTVTDSRGRTAESSKSITIHAYEPPKINSFTAERKGTNITVTKSCSYSAVGSNTISYSLTRTGGATGSAGNITHSTNSYTFGGYAVDKSFEFTLDISDKLNSASGVVVIGTGRQLLHIDKDQGFGVGKYREKGILDIEGDIHVHGDSNLIGNQNVTGRLGVGEELSVQEKIKTKNIEVSNRIEFPMNKFAGEGGAMNVRNSDIMGVNGIYFSDPVNAHGEGFMFPRGDVEIPESGIVSNNGYPGWDNLRVLDGAMFLNGNTVALGNNKDSLWEGGMYMTAGHVIEPSKKITDCPNGWALMWDQFRNGAVQGYGYNWTFVHKSQAGYGGGVHFILASSKNNYLSKYLYFNDPRYIRGNDDNNKAGSEYLVLKGVYAW